jgi:CubicO group peptidase (beta-lactamase class C family)
MKRTHIALTISSLIIIVLSFYGYFLKKTTSHNHNVHRVSLEKKLTPIIEQAMQTHGIPGLSVGVVQNNEIVYLKGFGYADIKTHSPITPNTIFHVASISKVFVATAIMQLVEQGLIDLDERIVNYVPNFKLIGDSYKEITVRQMLGHYSGMPNSNDYNWDKPEYDSGAIERYVKSLANFKMEYSPGEQFRYSNIAYEVLGHLISKVSGKSFCVYQKEKVLNKAGMPNSSFLKPKELPLNWANPHEMGLVPFMLDTYPFNRRHAPSSTLHTNAAEMCNWMLINLNKGSYGANKILNEQSVNSLWTQQIEYEEGGVGLGWFIGDYRGNRKIHHEGDDEGFQANMALLPDQSIGVIIMTNTLPAPINELTNSILDILLGHKPAPIKPLVSIPVMKVLKEKGIDEALTYWKDIEINHFEEYDFSPFQYYNLYFATIFERENEALLIAKLYSKILKTEEKKNLIGLMEYALAEKRGNILPVKIIKILKE